jgi:hypothetical protein
LKKFLSKMDFGISNFRFVVLTTVFLTSSSVFFSPYTISVDGFSYLKSSEVLFSNDFAAFYTWVREPGYPLFIRIFEDIGGLFLVFFIQGLFISFGILATILAVYRILKIESVSWKTFVSAGIAIVLVAGYASTILQQATLIALFGLLMAIISRIVTRRTLDWFTAALVFVLLLLSTLTAVFIGLAFGLALFATLVFSGVFNIKLLVSYSVLSILAFSLVMVPWSQIKSAEAPVGAPDAIELGALNTGYVLTNFNPEKEYYEAFLTQAALLNLGGEFPPMSGLAVANENRIFGTPAYSHDHVCGRFLTGQDPDTLWGKIETTYRDRCVPSRTLDLISFANRVAVYFYPLTGVALLVTLVLCISFRSHLRPIILPAFLITLPYIVMDASISRYGVLTVPLGAVLLGELIKPGHLLETKMKSKSNDKSDEVSPQFRVQKKN